jgi:hypothetical protein
MQYFHQKWDMAIGMYGTGIAQSKTDLALACEDLVTIAQG